MRILQVSALYPPILSGVANHVQELSSHLSARGHQVTCLCGSEKDDDEWPSASLHVMRRRFLHPKVLQGHDEHTTARSNITLIKDLVADIHKYDILHCHNAHLYGSTIADLAFELQGGIPLINTVHDHIGENLRLEILSRQWDELIYVSDFVRAHLPSNRPAVTAHLGIDLALFTRDGPSDLRILGLQRPIIYHPARLLPWKGVDVGLEAFATIIARGGKGTLVLTESDSIGISDSIPARIKLALRDRAADAGIQDHLVFADIPHADLPAAFRACDLVWYPTTGEEPYGLTPLEAAACGVPVIVTDSGGMAEAAARGLAIIVPRGDAVALADEAYHLLTDDSARNRLLQSSLRHIGSYSLTKYVSYVEAIYLGLTSQEIDPR